MKAQGVAKFELADITGDLRKNDNIDHEIGHLLGAHHSAYNLSEPGTSPNVAYLWTHVDKSSQPFHSNRTIMSYYDTCTNRWPPYTCWPEDNWSSPHPVSHWGQEPPTPVGTQTENNVSHISWLAPKVARFNDLVKPNSAPIPVIQISNNLGYVPDSTFTFDASGSTDGNNDPLTYDWVLNDSSGNQLKTSSSAAFIYQFNNIGSYSVQLTVDDGRGKSGSTIDNFVIAPAKPVLSSTKQSSNFLLSWNSVADANQYKVWEEFNDSWALIKTQTGTTFTKTFASMTDNLDYTYFVIACKDTICGNSSNYVTIKYDPSSGGGGGVPPPVCIPSPKKPCGEIP